MSKYHHSYPEYKGVRHCIKEGRGPSGQVRCMKYSPGPPEGPGRSSRRIRKCIKYQETPAGKRCKKYSGRTRCYGYKTGPSGLRRCAKYGPAYGHVPRRRSKTGRTREEAAAENPWINFVKHMAEINGTTFAEALKEPEVAKLYRVRHG